MGWKARNGKLYYYESVRVGGKVTSRYVGPGDRGEVARVIALLDRLDRRRAAIEARGELFAIEEEARAADSLHDATGLVVRLALELGGYHRQHRGPWRKIRMKTLQLEGPAYAGELGPQPEPIKSEADLDAILAANNGSREAMPAIRRMFARDPAGMIERMGGNLIKRAEANLISSYAKGNAAKALAVARKLREMRRELAGPRPTAIEKLVVERVVLAWAEVAVLDQWHADQCAKMSDKQEEYASRQRSRAHSRLMAATRTLASIRRVDLTVVQVAVDARSMPSGPPAQPDVVIEGAGG